jgi:hypothetical protein
MGVEAGAGGQDLAHRDRHVDLRRRRVLRIERQRSRAVAEHSEIVAEAEVIDPPADQGVARTTAQVTVYLVSALDGTNYSDLNEALSQAR